jgi:hypothetical protein
MKMLEATRDIPGEDVTRARTRVACDHPLAKKYPDAFREATDGPPSRSVEKRRYTGCKAEVRDGHGQRAAAPVRRSRLPLAEELQIRADRLAEINAPKRVESERGRMQRIFWSGSQALLDSMMDPRDRERAWKELREDAEHDETVRELGRLSREELELDRIDRDWGDAAPWN